jgi:hypothetical protein
MTGRNFFGVFHLVVVSFIKPENPDDITDQVRKSLKRKS